jgi:hypothetical protein
VCFSNHECSLFACELTLMFGNRPQSFRRADPTVRRALGGPRRQGPAQ